MKSLRFAPLAAVLVAGGASAQITTPAHSDSIRTTPPKVASGSVSGLPGAQPQPPSLVAGSFFGGSDDCATPEPIAGQGTFLFDNTSATTGVEGQGTCFFGDLMNDVWFRWTADASGMAIIGTCGETEVVTGLIVYPDNGCPADWSYLACDGDSCGDQAWLQFPVTAGESYLIQLGNEIHEEPGAGTFSISIGDLVPNDSCDNPAILVGEGVFAMTNEYATTGVEGQDELACYSFPGAWRVAKDVWFEWTASSSGNAVISTCGSAFDSRLRVYPGAGCPIDGSSIACDNYECGLEASVTIPVTAGQVFTIQVGSQEHNFGGSGSLDISIVEPPPFDDCADPAVITGEGSFPFDNRFASVGTAGQTEFYCGGGQYQSDHDVWFAWTSPETGTATLSLCSAVGETMLTVYEGAGCPADNTAYACNLGGCDPGTGSWLQMPVVAGWQYMIQVGMAQDSPGEVGNLEITVSLPPTNDDCANPEVIHGDGEFPFDLTLATQGIQGQIECYTPSGTLDHDVWFEWTADRDGRAIVRTCQSSVLTKLAVYPGTGCPLNGASVACVAYGCVDQAATGFDVIAGQTFTIQVGVNGPWYLPGPGIMELEIVEPQKKYVHDSGQSTNALGIIGGGAVMRLEGFHAAGGLDRITKISATYGTPHDPGTTSNLDVTVGLWDDPTNDFDPSDAVLLWSMQAHSANEDTDQFNHYAVPYVPVDRVFFVGVLCESLYGEYPVAMDNGISSGGRSWLVGNNTDSGGYGAFDLMNLANNSTPPLDSEQAFGGVGMVRAEGASSLGTSYCSTLANSTGGASVIQATGSATLSSMNLVLSANHAPANQLAVFYAGTNATQVPFGNGFRCAGGSNLRFPEVIETAGSFSYPIDFSTYGDILATFQTAYFQCWYRDPAAGGAFFNLSDALEVVFVP